MSAKVALVTGASRGIGKAIANQLGSQGFIVVGTATSESGAEKISAYLKDAGIEGLGLCLNVTDADSVSDVLKMVSDQFSSFRNFPGLRTQFTLSAT